ncbi:MAG: hypothetical protein ACK2UW_09850 [Anaerolineales bacterium]|jgi:hypothetical protein
MPLYLFPGILLVCLMALLVARSRFRQRTTGWLYALGVTVTTYIPMGVFGLLAAVKIFLAYSGWCYGFSSGAWACSLGEYLIGQLFYLLLFLMIPSFILAMFIGLMLFLDLLRYGTALTPASR